MKHRKRPEKKSESLDVRLPYSVKRAFMAATRRNGETASAAVRRFIDGYIEETEAGAPYPLFKDTAMTVKRNPLKSLAIISGAAGALSLAALPSAADPSAFEKLDKNNDGVLVADEIAPGHGKTIIEILDVDKSGSVSKAEFDNPPEGVVVKASVIGDGESDGDVERKISVRKISHSANGDPMTEDEIKLEVREAIREAHPDATDAEIDEMAGKATVKTMIIEEEVVKEETTETE